MVNSGQMVVKIATHVSLFFSRALSKIRSWTAFLKGISILSVINNYIKGTLNMKKMAKTLSRTGLNA